MNKIDDEGVFTRSASRFGWICAVWRILILANGCRCQGLLTAENLWLAIERQRSFCADGGEKLGIKPTHLCVPTGLEKSATKLLERELNVDEGRR